jgi:large subunit ribosomal protein L24
MKIKKGDNVIVMTGKDKGKKGKVLESFPAKGKIIIEGLNVFKKHQKARKSNEKGSIIEVSRPLQASNVMIVESGKPVRVGYKKVGDKNIRVSKKTDKEL